MRYASLPKEGDGSWFEFAVSDWVAKSRVFSSRWAPSDVGMRSRVTTVGTIEPVPMEEGVVKGVNLGPATEVALERLGERPPVRRKGSVAEGTRSRAEEPKAAEAAPTREGAKRRVVAEPAVPGRMPPQ